MYRLFLSPHSLSVTTVTLGFRLFFILLQINLLLIVSFRLVRGKLANDPAQQCEHFNPEKKCKALRVSFFYFFLISNIGAT